MFFPPRVCRRRGDAGFLVMVGHSLCHFQEKCDVSSTSAWLRAALGQPSPGRTGEVLALLWLNASSVTSGFFSSTRWLCRPAIGGLAEPTDPLKNPPCGQITTSDLGHVLLMASGCIKALVGQCHPSPLSLLPALPGTRSPWGLPDGDGDTRRKEEEEVLNDPGTGRAADGRGSGSCFRQALANNQGPGFHGSSQFDPNRPKLGYSMQRAGPQAKLPSQL